MIIISSLLNDELKTAHSVHFCKQVYHGEASSVYEEGVFIKVKSFPILTLQFTFWDYSNTSFKKLLNKLIADEFQATRLSFQFTPLPSGPYRAPVYSWCSHLYDERCGNSTGSTFHVMSQRWLDGQMDTVFFYCNFNRIQPCYLVKMLTDIIILQICR